MESVNVDTILDIVLYVLSASGVCAWISAALNKEYSNKYSNFIVKLIKVVGGQVFKNNPTNTSK